MQPRGEGVAIKFEHQRDIVGLARSISLVLLSMDHLQQGTECMPTENAGHERQCHPVSPAASLLKKTDAYDCYLSIDLSQFNRKITATRGVLKRF
jgi:hypothetical protein